MTATDLHCCAQTMCFHCTHHQLKHCQSAVFRPYGRFCRDCASNGAIALDDLVVIERPMMRLVWMLKLRETHTSFEFGEYTYLVLRAGSVLD